MGEVLSFDLNLSHAGFNLRGACDVPLQGITGISGPSGSGKTTLLRALTGLEPSVQGRVVFAGQEWTDLAPQDRAVGFVFQDMRLFRHMSVAQNLAYGAKRRDVADGKVDEVIEAFDLGALLNRRPASLSGGEARRVALGRAMAMQPKILMLDEPMVGLDTRKRAEVLPYITRASDMFGLAVLYVSHSQFEMNLLADRILPIEDGVVGALRDGPPRFNLPVVGASDGRVLFQLDGAKFAVAGDGQSGQNWEIRLGNGGILSRNHPGENSAAAVLPVVVERAEPDRKRVAIRVADTVINVRSEVMFARGETLWLLCPNLRARYRGN